MALFLYLLLVGIVPAFAYPAMDMSGMGGMGGMTMPSGMDMSRMMNGMSDTWIIPPPPTGYECPFVPSGRTLTPQECTAAMMKSLAPPPAPTPLPAEIPKEVAPEDIEDLEAIEELESALELKAEQAALKQELAARAKEIDKDIIQPFIKSLSRVKGRNAKKLIKSAVKAIEKSLTKARDKSCAEYPTEVYTLQCELLFTNSLQAVKLASMKKNASPTNFTKALEELRSGLKDISAE